MVGKGRKFRNFPVQFPIRTMDSLLRFKCIMISFVMHRFESIRKVFSELSENTRNVLQTVIQAFAAAIGAVAFMQAIHIVYATLYRSSLIANPKLFIPLSLLINLVTAFLASWLMRSVVGAAGSGIPQAKLAYWKELGFIPFKTVLVKFFAGILSVGGGASLGREGPTVFLGSGIASSIDGLFGANKRNRRGACVVGASAGLAAAFNTPLAAITFCIEEMIGDLNTRYLGRVVLASLVGALVVYATIGRQPSFVLPSVEPGRWELFLFIPIVAVFASGLGILFHKWALVLRSRVRKNEVLPLWAAPVLGAFLTWCVGISVYLLTGKVGIFGLGYMDLSEMLTSGAIWWIAAVLLVGKMAATIFSYSFGGCGGIFSPTLFIGGFAGAAISGIVAQWFPLSHSELVILASIGMSACMGSVIRAPLTATLIVFEMTHQFEIVPGLMMSAAISILMAKKYGEKHNFYDDLLVQDGHAIHKIIPPKDMQSWQNRSVGEIMNSRPVSFEHFETERIKKLLQDYPFRVFIQVKDNVPVGFVSRTLLENFLGTQQIPKLVDPVVSSSQSTVRDVSELFIESPLGLVALVDRDMKLEGLLTMHDLLRAQVAASE